MRYTFLKVDGVIFKKQNSSGINTWKKSNIGEILSGVPRVSILRPLLFLVFINDSPLALSQKVLATDLYAEFFTTFYDIQPDLETLRSNLQESLLILQQWCRENRI